MTARMGRFFRKKHSGWRESYTEKGEQSGMLQWGVKLSMLGEICQKSREIKKSFFV